MSNDADRQIEVSDAELEREIRQRRKFTPQEAIGRLAGEGAMKGGSAISLQQQAENEIHQWLTDHVEDPAGALRTVLHRQLEGSELLLKNLDRPLVVLAKLSQRLLATDNVLKELVRQADVEWGRSMDERPHFEREGARPNPDDPYTVDSVRAALTAMIERLNA